MATAEAPLREIIKSISFTKFPLRTIDTFFVAEKIEKPRLYCYPPPPPPLEQSQSSIRATAAGVPEDLASLPRLPTFDVKSLCILTALRFIDYDFDVEYTSEPDASPDKQLPFLLFCDGSVLCGKEIMGRLRGVVPGPSSTSDASDRKDSSAALERLWFPETDLPSELVYRTMAERNLVPAIEYMAWGDPVGRECIGVERYLGHYPGIIQSILGWIKSSEVIQGLKMMQPEYTAGNSMRLDGGTVYETAFHALDSLLVLFEDVGDSRMFLVGKRSLLDAVVFSCISVALDAPVDSPLRKALLCKNEYRRVLDYALRLRRLYFS
ncbi:Metaxin-2 [Coemansia sp. BCRC 34490]|nr:Metaxin-2 [Coemansia sp. BCRC 34490]